jgi:hypothetical protein
MEIHFVFKNIKTGNDSYELWFTPEDSDIAKEEILNKDFTFILNNNWTVSAGHTLKWGDKDIGTWWIKGSQDNILHNGNKKYYNQAEEISYNKEKFNDDLRNYCKDIENTEYKGIFDINTRTMKIYRNDIREELRRMFLEFIEEIEKEKWFGKERELVSRFTFSKLVKNVGCCSELYDTRQFGIEVRVEQVVEGKKEVCKDMVIWKKPNQNVWSEDNVPICIIEWKHRNKIPYQYDIDWLKEYTKKYPNCFGIALNVENENEYSLKAVLIEKGEITDEDWV